MRRKCSEGGPRGGKCGAKLDWKRDLITWPDGVQWLVCQSCGACWGALSEEELHTQ